MFSGGSPAAGGLESWCYFQHIFSSSHPIMMMCLKIYECACGQNVVGVRAATLNWPPGQTTWPLTSVSLTLHPPKWRKGEYQMYCLHVSFMQLIFRFSFFSVHGSFITAGDVLGRTDLCSGSSNVRGGSTLVLLHLVLRKGNALMVRFWSPLSSEEGDACNNQLTIAV